MRTRSIVIGAIALGFTVLVPVTVVQAAPKCTRALLKQGLLPDLQTVVPKHLQIHNEIQTAGHREFLRFTNGIANEG